MVPRFMRRPPASLELHLYGETFSPGSEIGYRVLILSRTGFPVRVARVSMECVETYWVVTSDGKNTRQARRTRRISEVSSSFLEGGTIRPGLAHREESSLRLPDDAPLSVRGKRANLAWRMRLAVDVPGARDVHAETPFTVVSPSARLAGSAPPLVVNAAFEECDLRLAVPGGRLAAGDAVEGRLYVTARSRCEFPEVRVELARREKAGVKKSVTVAGVSILEKQAVLDADQRREWAYSLTVPDGVFPTTDISDTSVTWEVKAVLTRSLRTDFPLGAEINVA